VRQGRADGAAIGFDTDCGVALITREMRQRYPFMRVH
jgi:hypothetical protein